MIEFFHCFCCCFVQYFFFFIIRVKARAIPSSAANQSDNTVSVAQVGTTETVLSPWRLFNTIYSRNSLDNWALYFCWQLIGYLVLVRYKNSVGWRTDLLKYWVSHTKKSFNCPNNFQYIDDCSQSYQLYFHLFSEWISLNSVIYLS